MKKYKALYKGMYDDLKDAEMMIDYAYCIREEQEADKNLADEIAKYAQYRLQHFTEFHHLFENEAEKQKSMDSDTVDKCMWNECQETLQEWHDEIERKINKY